MLVFVKETIGKNLTIKFLEAGLLKALFDKTYKLIMVLLHYWVTDFQSIEKPKGGPLEIEKFFVEEG